MEFLEIIKEFIKPELMILVPVIYFIGMGLKRSTLVNDKYIPMLLGLFAIILCVIWVMATSDIGNYKDVLMAIFVAITQGVICTGLSVYVNQLFKQKNK